MIRYAVAAAAGLLACAPAVAADLSFLPPIAVDLTSLNTGTITAETDLLFLRIENYDSTTPELFDGTPIALDGTRHLYIRYKLGDTSATDPYREINLIGFNGTLSDDAANYLARQSYIGLRGIFDIKFVGDGNALGTGVFAMDLPSDITGEQFIFRSNSASLTRLAFQQVAAPVPEPATWALTIIGFGAIGFAARQRQGIRHALAR